MNTSHLYSFDVKIGFLAADIAFGLGISHFLSDLKHLLLHFLCVSVFPRFPLLLHLSESKETFTMTISTSFTES